MKKIISLVFASIICSQVVLAADDAERIRLLQQQIAAAKVDTARIKRKIESSGGICAWMAWLFGGCVRVGEVVERNPLMSCCCLSLCCCCCSAATTAVIATESLTPGVFAVCNMCKSGEVACSLISFGCASGDKCGTTTVVKACAHCVSDIARRAQRGCLSAEHMQ